MTSSRAYFLFLLAAVGGACSNSGVPSGPRGGFDFAGSSNNGLGGSTGGANSGGNTMVGVGGKLASGGTGGGSGGAIGAGGSKIGSGGTGVGGASTGGGAAQGGATAAGGSGPVSLTTGLIGHWKFDEATVGTTAMDSVGANHGTFSASKPTLSTDVPAPLAGKSTACLTFDGATNDLVLPAAPAFSNWTHMTSFSISVWVNVATFKGWVGIIANEPATPNYCGLYISSEVQPPNAAAILDAFAFESNELTPATVAKVVTLNTWHHVAIVQDSTRAQSIYIDGVAAPGTRPPQHCEGTSPFHIGSPDGTGGFFQGSLDDVRFYNRALSPAEVSELYAGQP